MKRSVLLTLACLMLSGCGTVTTFDDLTNFVVDVKKFVDETEELRLWFQTLPDIVKEQSEPDATGNVKVTDQIPMEKIKFHGGRWDIQEAELTHDLGFEGKFGGQVRLVQTFTKEVGTPFDVVGVCWLLIPRNDGSGMWDAYQWDYIRPGQTLRHFPWDNKERDIDYPPVTRTSSFGVMISTLARDHRTNGKKRTITVKVR